MSFSVNMYPADTCLINSYAAAVALYYRCKDKGAGDGHERPIKGKETSKQMGVSIASNGDVQFRYHRTDVIVWHKNNSYTINTFGSISTCAFASAFMPAGHHLSNTGSRIYIGNYREAVVYAIYDKATIKGDKVKTDAVFSKEVVNRAEAKKVLATTRYAEYRKWHAAMFPMVRDNMTRDYQREYLRTHEGVEMLYMSDEWHRLMMSREGHPNTIRQCIYNLNYAQVYDRVTQKTLSAKESRAKWEVSPTWKSVG